MKFLVDAQLPKALSDFLKTRGHDSVHTFELPGRNATTDLKIIEIATKDERVVITKDNDFLESHMVRGKPEKLVIVRTGNIKNNSLIKLFEYNIITLVELLLDNSLIEINQTEIIVHT
jgi:predicted nuclease of predicted toxin-antitoxin system